MSEKQPREIKLIQLANGAMVPDVTVEVTMLSLKDLIASNAIAFYELVTKCRDEKHQFWGNTEKVLINAGLIQRPGEIHDSIRDVVLSAAKGDGLEMTLNSPLPVLNQDQK